MAAEFGVLVRDADALQRASTLDTVVFDKTGTLTEGKPQVVAVKTFADVDEAQALRLAAALEQGSSHPLARAILDKQVICSCRRSTVSGHCAGWA